MVQPKYSPEEALQRIKLMMEYDSSKTYTENKVIVENKIPLNEALPVLALWAIAATVATGASAIYGREFASADVQEQIKLALGACDSVTGDAAKTSMSDPEHAKIANIFRNSFAYQTLGFLGGTDLDLLKEALSMLEEGGRMGDFCKVRESYGAGSKLENDLISELGTKELNYVINTMNVLAAKSKAGTVPIEDEETAQTSWWRDNFRCLQFTDSFADPMIVDSDRYGMTYMGVVFKVKGQLKQFNMDKDGKIYIPDPLPGGKKHKYTGKKVNCSSQTKVSIVAESVKKKRIFEQADLGDIDFFPVDTDLDPATPTPSPDPGTIPPVRTSGYRSCSGSYSFGCKADAIATVQKCLGGLVVDGKFGPRTQAALKAKGYESFTDAEVDKICGNPTGVDTEISGESPADTDMTNQDF
jgi:hypothetical protein